MYINIVFSVCFIMVSIPAYFGKYKLAGIIATAALCYLSVLCSLVYPPLPFFLSLPLLGILFSGIIALLYLYNVSGHKQLAKLSASGSQQAEQLNSLENKNKILQAQNKKLEHSLAEIKNIYAYVTNLGSTMEFDEAIITLRNTLISLLDFAKGRLILIDNNKITNIFAISPSGKLPANNRGIPCEYEHTIVSQMVVNPQMLFYEKGKRSSLGILPANIANLLAIPLLAEKQLLGILTLENLDLIATDKIHFIALQFALEIKKTRLYEKVKALSIIDSLTQLYLRRHFMKLFNNELDRGHRRHLHVSFLMIDIDFFKKCNDEHGHLAGDLVLKEVAAILQEKSREGDLLCRYGGDEFALVLPTASLPEAAQVAERLRNTINKHPFQIGKTITVSIGVTVYNPADKYTDAAADTLIDHADKALYQAKTQGRNRVVITGQ